MDLANTHYSQTKRNDPKDVTGNYHKHASSKVELSKVAFAWHVLLRNSNVSPKRKCALSDNRVTGGASVAPLCFVVSPNTTPEDILSGSRNALLSVLFSSLAPGIEPYCQRPTRLFAPSAHQDENCFRSRDKVSTHRLIAVFPVFRFYLLPQAWQSNFRSRKINDSCSRATSVPGKSTLEFLVETNGEKKIGNRY